MNKPTQSPLRVAIAEASGWNYDELNGRGFWDNGRARVYDEDHLPDYPGSRTAMYWARKQHILTPALKVKFLNSLRAIIHKRLKRPVSDYDLMDCEPNEEALALAETLQLTVF